MDSQLSSLRGRPDQGGYLALAQRYSPDLPWTNSDPAALGPVVMKFVRDHEPFFKRWADTWYENFQFIFGNHNIKWSKRYGFAVDYDFLRRGSPFALRSQTNIARVVAEALASLIYSNLPTWDVDTMDESAVKGKRYAKIVQKLLDCYMQRLSMDKELAAAALIYVVFGQVAAKVDWNYTGGKLLEIPKYQKIQSPVYTTYMAPNPVTGGLLEVPVQAKDAMGNPVTEERWEEVLDSMGRQIIDKFFAGDTFVDILTPFEYRREIGSRGTHKTRWMQHVRLLDYDQYLDEYYETPGKTKYFGQIRPIYQDPDIYSLAVKQFMRMQFTTPPSVDEGFRRNENVLRSSLFRYKVLVVEHYDRPHPIKWPLGRKLVVANGFCTHVTTPTYNTNKLDGWHPFLEAQWMNLSPSSIASGPMQDVVRKNRELDVKDSLIATAVRRNMGSQLLVKTGSGADPQKITGEPGQAHEVNDPYGVRWLHDDMPLPAVLPALRQMDKDDVYDTSGAGEALRGQPSTGASSGYQEKQREEREEKRLTPPRKSFEFFVSGIGEKIWSCTKTNVVKLGDDVVGYLRRAAAGEYTIDEVVAMLSSTVDFGVDVKVEKSSMAVKSKATHQATLMELASGPFAQRLMTDAGVLDTFAEEFDAQELRDDSSAHRDRAGRENEVFGDMCRLGVDMEGVRKPIVLFEDDDKVHMASHAKWLIQNLEEVLANEMMLLEFLTHQETHRIQDQEKQGQVMPGTSLQVPGMVQASAGIPTPTSQTVAQDSMMRKATQQQQQQQPGQPPPQGGGPQQPGQAPQGGRQAPQAPKVRTGGPRGAKTTNPAAPSSATPPARAGGMGGRNASA